MAENEHERKRRVIDQMITAHSVLRDRFKRRAFFLSISLLTAAVVLNACVFVRDDVLTGFGLDPKRANIVLGVASAFTFLISLIEVRVDWSGQSRLHEDGVKKLFRLKLALCKLDEATQEDAPHKNEKQNEEFERVMSEIVPLPEGEFNSLKARHRFKVELSKRIDQHPSAPLWWLRLRLRVEGFRGARIPTESHE